MDISSAQSKLEEGVQALVTSSDWLKALAFAARFHNYSFGNTLLIHLQCPGASRVAGYRTWEKLGRHVKRGERGIAILAPVLFKRETEADEEIQVLRGFRVVHVFDVDQTEGKPLPPDQGFFVQRLQGGTERDRAIFSVLSQDLQRHGWKVERTGLAGYSQGTNGLTDYIDRSVQVRSGLSDAQSLKTLMHEFAHATLHDGARQLEDRGLLEAEAESAAFIAAQVIGLDTSSYSIGYVATWSAGKFEIVQRAGANALRAAKEILQALGVHEEEEAA